MTYAIYGEIEFPASRTRGKVLVRRFSKVKIESSWKKLTDTAEVVLPRKVKDFDRFKINEVFQAGDPIIIRMGYDGELVTEFEGYIFKVTTGVPVVITCEDEMYMLKRETVSVSKASCNLKELLNAIAPGYTVLCDDTAIGSVRYANKLVSEILDDLKSKMGLNTYFRGKTLVCGRTSIDGGSRVKVTLERQASETMKERNVEQVYVKVESLQKNGKMLKADKGEKKGNSIVIKQPNLTKIEIERVVDDAYAKAMKPGLEGDLTLFGIPRVQHGMIVDLKSMLYAEKKVAYYVDSVTKTVEHGQGYRQVAKLGDKTS
ncbi:MAG: hypothetical protein WCG93_12355 [Paludibacter sp.]